LLDAVIIGQARSTVDTTSLIDTFGLRGGDDEHNGKEVMIYDATGSIVDGSKSRVSDYAGSTSDATVSPAFSASITSGDLYEMWEDWIDIDELNDQINLKITELTGIVKNIKQTATTYAERDKAEYAALTSFTHLSTVEYVESIIEREEMASGLWTAAANVTAASDTELYRGRTCTKLTVGAGVAAAAQLGYVASSIADYSNCDTIELWIRSDIAQTAANLELLLCSDALGVTAVDTISLPILAIDTWTRVQLTLTNPELDTAILSIALKQKAATDIGACKIWLEYPLALKASSRVFKVLASVHWEIVKGSTPYLKLTPSGRSVVSNDALLRLTGYQNATLFSDETTDGDIDPSYLINAVAGDVLLNHYKGRRLDNAARLERAKFYLGEAERAKRAMTTNLAPNTRSI
jgi:hypothetical protein